MRIEMRSMGTKRMTMGMEIADDWGWRWNGPGGK